MNYRNARLANGFLSLDKLAGEVDLEKARIGSDGGAGVERLVEEIDRNGGRGVGAAEAARFDDGTIEAARFDGGEAQERRRKLRAAIGRLRRAGRGYLVPVLRLIVKNGSERNRSLEKISRASYFRHRDELLRFFS